MFVTTRYMTRASYGLRITKQANVTNFRIGILPCRPISKPSMFNTNSLGSQVVSRHLRCANFSTAAATVTTGGFMGILYKYPFSSQVAIATTKTSIADLLIQKKVEMREAIDWRRNALFIMFGGLYLGVFQWVVYVMAFQKIFPEMSNFCNQSIRAKLRNKKGLKELAGQILLDFFFIQPLLYFPVFYGFKTFVEPSDNGNSRFQNALNNWKKNFWVDNLGMSGFWLPMDLIIYSVPLHIRLPLNHAISFLWVCVLSFFRGE